MFGYSIATMAVKAVCVISYMRMCMCMCVCALICMNVCLCMRASASAVVPQSKIQRGRGKKTVGQLCPKGMDACTQRSSRGHIKTDNRVEHLKKGAALKGGADDEQCRGLHVDELKWRG